MSTFSLFLSSRFFKGNRINIYFVLLLGHVGWLLSVNNQSKTEFLLDFTLHINQYIIEIVQEYRTWAHVILSLVTFCETESVATPFLPRGSLLFAAGVIAVLLGIPLKVNPLALILPVAVVLGDSCNYMIGHFFDHKLSNNPNSRIFKKSHLNKMHELYKEYGDETIVIARFVPIVRTFVPFVAGTDKMHYYYFTIHNLIGDAFQVLLFCYAGYFFGDPPLVQWNFKLLITAIIFISIFPAVIEAVWARLKTRKR